MNKKNLKLFAVIILIMIMTNGISIYATTEYLVRADQVNYTKSDGNVIDVGTALNDLYTNKKDTSDDTQSITTNGNQTLDKYYKYLNVNVPIPNGYIQPSGSLTISASGTYNVSNYASVEVNIQDIANVVSNVKEICGICEGDDLHYIISKIVHYNLMIPLMELIFNLHIIVVSIHGQL